MKPRYLTEALEKEKVIPKRVTKNREKKKLRSRRSRLADELVFLGDLGEDVMNKLKQMVGMLCIYTYTYIYIYIR